MIIYPCKTKELAVYPTRRRSPIELANPLLEGAERVHSLRVLGVVLNSKLTMADDIIETCSSSTYAYMYVLRFLCLHGIRSREFSIWFRELQQYSHDATCICGSCLVGVRWRREQSAPRMLNYQDEAQWL